MDNRLLLIQELNSTPDALLGEVLDFLRYLKVKNAGVDLEDLIDSNDLQQTMAHSEGLVSAEELLAIRPIEP
jgi:hypothetical protein